MNSTLIMRVVFASVLIGLAGPAARADGEPPEGGEPQPAAETAAEVVPSEDNEAGAVDPDAPVPGDSTPVVAPTEPVPQAPAGVRVAVRRLESDGTLTPLAGVEVRRERYRKLGGMDGGSELSGAFTAQTGANGVAIFPTDPAPGVAESDSFVATWAGLEWDVTGTEGQSELAATVFALTTKTDAFRMGLQAFVELRDTNFMVQQQYTLINNSFDAIDLSGGEGLRIPLLIHEVFGDSLNFGYLPTRTDNQRTRFELKPSRGRLTIERGTLIFRGVVPPGRSVQVLASFAVPYAEEDAHVLSLSAPHDLDDVRITVVAPDRSGLKATLRGPHRSAPRPVSGGEELWLIPLEPPKAGQPLQLVLDHTPDRRAVTRNIATALAGAVVFVISAIFFATRRRRKAT